MHCSAPRLLAALLVGGLLGCSSSDNNGKRDDAGKVDAGGDATVTDAPPADKQSPADAKPEVDTGPRCDPTVIGKACSPGDSTSCGAAPHHCVDVGGGAGFCSCDCKPDVAKTVVSSEDSCPQDHACYLGGASSSACGLLVASASQHPNCASSTVIVADATDKTLLFAVRLTPPSYPFWVTAVRYLLEPTEAECDVGAPHKAMVFIGDNTPPASPIYLEEFAVPAASSGADPVWKFHALTAPVKLEQGQQLFAAVEIPVEGGKSACLQVCSDQAGAGGKSFIVVNDTEPPFTWESFTDLEWPGELTIAAIGFEG